MFQVMAFYPNIGVPVRVTEYKSKYDAFEYVGALRLTDTPYAMWDEWNKLIEMETFDLTREQMAKMVEEHL